MKVVRIESRIDLAWRLRGTSACTRNPRGHGCRRRTTLKQPDSGLPLLELWRLVPLYVGAGWKPNGHSSRRIPFVNPCYFDHGILPEGFVLADTARRPLEPTGRGKLWLGRCDRPNI